MTVSALESATVPLRARCLLPNASWLSLLSEAVVTVDTEAGSATTPLGRFRSSFLVLVLKSSSGGVRWSDERRDHAGNAAKLGFVPIRQVTPN